MSMYLLDTHILLWWLSDDKKLKKQFKEIVTNPDNHIFISSISILEIVIKKSLNKLDAPENIKEVINDNNFKFLNVTIDHVLHLENLPYLHNDPFDRILISQSNIENLILITNDKQIHKYNVKYL